MNSEILSQAAADLSRDGVVCLRNVLTDAEVRALRDSVDAQIRDRKQSSTAYDFESLGREVWERGKALDAGAATRLDLTSLKDNVASDPLARPLRDKTNGEGLFLYDVAGWKKHKGIRDVALDSALPEIAFNLMETGYVNFWEDTTFVKAPGTQQRTAFHQDLAYFQIDGDDCIIIWIPLDPADLGNGVVEYVRGSHKWADTFAPNVFVSQTTTRGSPGPRLPDIEADRDAYDIVSFDVMPGDVIVHHVRTVHGAGGNPSDRMRRAISFRYCGSEVRYFDRPGAVPQVATGHCLTDGDRLFSADYPMVYPRPWPGLKLSKLYEADLMESMCQAGVTQDA